MFDEMEHIDADDGAREHFFRNRNKAVVHVTAVEVDYFRMVIDAVMWRDCV